MNRFSEHCAALFSYFLRELPEAEERAFETHLAGCAACQEELKQLKMAWETLPYKMEELEPPEQLKSEVLGAILQKYPAADAVSKPAERDMEPRPVLVKTEAKRKKSAVWRYAAAAVIVVLIGFAGWTEVSRRLDKATGHTQLHTPTQLVGQYSLKSFDPGVPAAAGSAWIMKKGESMELVLQTSGLPKLQGNQVYQVWLVKSGDRHNCGTFRVDSEGNGVLTYVIDEDDREFDTIGITLEPDSGGMQPRGKKILGT
ncbi:anti-sigma factor [Paenibacillus ginsengarvi]|uniref:Anti-sigma-W factor RsiW n=1 Tax=Paenibacillus ginsengarvi TaxID=400777 RepID=A0A3B0BCQ9_9BACL|nr:anti-sigma factor [Paenibacillus ginsengarvi]RKN70161.1 hypothetical protein D7M11_30655 [Paenibacillus ginsengarvi]